MCSATAQFMFLYTFTHSYLHIVKYYDHHSNLNHHYHFSSHHDFLAKPYYTIPLFSQFHLQLDWEPMSSDGPKGMALGLCSTRLYNLSLSIIPPKTLLHLVHQLCLMTSRIIQYNFKEPLICLIDPVHSPLSFYFNCEPSFGSRGSATSWGYRRTNQILQEASDR